MTRINILYGSQTSPVVVCMQNNEIDIRETSIYGANHADLHAQNDRWGLGPKQICNSAPKVAVLHAKTTEKGWDHRDK